MSDTKQHERKDLKVSLLEEIGNAPKTVDELKAIVEAQKMPKEPTQQSYKPKKAVDSRSQFKVLHDDREARLASAGFSAAIVACALGVVSAGFMFMSGDFHILHSIIIMVFSCTLLIKSIGLKSFSSLVFIANIVYILVIFIKQFSSGKPIEAMVLDLVMLGIAIAGSVACCAILFSNDNLEKYYNSKKNTDREF